MKQIIRLLTLGLMLLFFAISAKGQINYVQNPSFEIYDTCPNTYGQIKYARYWSNLINHSGGTADFLHACANPDTLVSVPKNSLGYQAAKSGLGYGLLGLFEYLTSVPNGGAREFMNNQLKDKLIANKQYCVKAYLSLCEAGFCGVDGFGFYFDNGTFMGGNPPNTTAQVENIAYNIIMDTANWVVVFGTFTATGNEAYINLGNFRNNLNTHFTPTANYPGFGYYVSGYYIDDVSVIESDLPAFAGNDTALQNIGDSLYLGRPAEIGLECTWYNWAGDSIGTGAGIWVTPSHTQPYIVEQNLCGTIKRDTVYVSVGTSIENAATLQGVKVFPNPSQGSFSISIPSLENSEVAISICEISGKEVYHRQQFCKGEITIATKLATSMYVLYVKDVHTGASAMRRIVVQ